MTTSATSTIRRRIEELGPGSIFTPADFRGLDTPSAILNTLSLLVRQNQIVRLANGVYVLPKRDPLLGAVKPSLDQIVLAIATKKDARIIPGGAIALNRLGLSTQVPANPVYLTDGSSRTLTIGNRKVHLKRTAPRYFQIKGEISQLVVQALRELGKEGLTEAVRQTVYTKFESEKREHLEHDAQKVPAWISEVFYSYLNRGKF